MTKALLWKEWRTQRPLILAGLSLAAIMPLFMMAGLMAASYNWDFEDLVALMIPIFGAVIWPLFAAATAGSAFATDMSDDSMRFLLSRPVSRARVWFVKVGAAVLALLSVIVGTSLICLVYALLSADRLRFPRDIAATLVRSFEPESLVVVLPFAFLFGCSIYCSMFMRRPMAAAVGGFLLAAGLSIGVGLLWRLLMPFSLFIWPATNLLEPLIISAVPLGTICIWGAAFWVFWRGDIFAGDARRRALRPLLTVVALVVLLGAGPAMWGGVRTMASVAARSFGNLALVDGAVTVPELTPSGLSTQLRRVPVDGSPATILPPEHATNPSPSPDGAWVVYLDHGGYSGMAANEIELRAVRADGSDDHAISETLHTNWYSPAVIIVAPDSDRVAYLADGNLVLTSISEGAAATVHVDLAGDLGITGRGDDVIGWTTGRPPQLLYYRTTSRLGRYTPPTGSPATEMGPAMRRTELLALDPASGESRVLIEFPGRHVMKVWGSRWSVQSGSSAGWTWLPAWIDDADADRMYALETTTGDLVELSDSPCRVWGFSADHRSILYGNCSGEMRYGDGQLEIRIRDLETGIDERFALLENFDDSGVSRELFLSPDGQRLLMHTRRGYGSDWSTYLISRGGGARMLDQTRIPVGWVDDQEALLVRFHLYWQPYLSVVNVDTGTHREIFP